MASEDPVQANETTKWPRVAVVGCGYWGKNLVRNFAELGVLEVLVDADAARTAELSAKHGGRVASFEAVLADPSIAAVALATPGPAHFAQATAALAAGKHVYVEKPMTMSSFEAEKLVAHAETSRRTLMVGHILRHHAAFRHVTALVEAGRIGRVRHVVSTRFNLGKILTDEDVVWSLAPHDFAMVTALLGRDPERVNAHGDVFLRPGVADQATIRFDYGAGEKSAEVRVSWMSPVKEHRLVVVGERGALIFDDTKPWDEKVVLRLPGLDWSDPAVTPAAGESIAQPLAPAEPLKDECRHFLECAAGGARPLTDGAEGLAVARLLERASASIAAAGAPR